MKFRKGTKVSISYLDRRGQRKITKRWWNQVDYFLRRGNYTDTKVKGLGWKAWKAYDPSAVEMEQGEAILARYDDDDLRGF